MKHIRTLVVIVVVGSRRKVRRRGVLQGRTESPTLEKYGGKLVYAGQATKQAFAAIAITGVGPNGPRFKILNVWFFAVLFG